ncbi:pentapeptide repeat-containing protein [Lewinella cohaerens]|uniref:pentapeptide repeat-containing protein n=1 Tax=Lewinella cohaerens TaxID=70995 RepID=UPI000371AA26|nr:pentapeptide repeat-containing protein [Lewinella cohaerens]
MYKYLITLLTGIVIGALVFFDSAEKILDFFLDRWQMALIIALVMILFAWAIYTFFDKIAQKALGVVVPEYPELVENTFQAVENYREGNKEELSENLQVLLKKVAAKYGEWRARRFFLGVLLGVVTLLFSIFGSLLLRNQNILIATQVKNEEIAMLERKIDKIRESLQNQYTRNNRPPTELVESFFEHVNALDNLGVYVSNVRLSGMQINGDSRVSGDLSNIYIDNSNFQHSSFVDCNFKNSDLSHSVISNCNFYNCNMDSITLKGVDLDRVVFRKTESLSFCCDDTYFGTDHDDTPDFNDVIFLENEAISAKEIKLLRSWGATIGKEEVLDIIDSLRIECSKLEKKAHNSYEDKNIYDYCIMDLEWFEGILNDKK